MGWTVSVCWMGSKTMISLLLGWRVDLGGPCGERRGDMDSVSDLNEKIELWSVERFYQE